MPAHLAVASRASSDVRCGPGVRRQAASLQADGPARVWYDACEMEQVCLSAEQTWLPTGQLRFARAGRGPA